MATSSDLSLYFQLKKGEKADLARLDSRFI